MRDGERESESQQPRVARSRAGGRAGRWLHRQEAELGSLSWELGMGACVEQVSTKGLRFPRPLLGPSLPAGEAGVVTQGRAGYLPVAGSVDEDWSGARGGGSSCTGESALGPHLTPSPPSAQF